MFFSEKKTYRMYLWQLAMGPVRIDYYDCKNNLDSSYFIIKNGTYLGLNIFVIDGIWQINIFKVIPFAFLGHTYADYGVVCFDLS